MKFSLLKRIRHLFEGAFVGSAFIFFHHLLPTKQSLALGGWIGRNFGPLLPWSKRARRNLRKCFPDMTSIEIKKIIKEMWENFGLLAAEYASPDAFWDGKTLRNIEIVGLENLKHFQNDGKPGIIFTAHTGNWQMITLAAQSIGFDLTQMYRPANNPWVDTLMLKCQKLAVKNVITKRQGGPRDLFSLIKRGEHALLLIDQKLGEGMAIPFLGREAMTATGVARMYLNQNCPLLPARSERLHGSHFRVTFYPPINYIPKGDHRQDMYDLLLSINTMLGEWIKERPGQWLWLHRRWKN